MNKVFLSLGSNQGDRIMWLNEAIQLITLQAGRVEEKSSIYQTVPWGLPDQPDFLNMVLLIHTHLSPHILLQTILSIELSLGRERIVKWGPRTIDIDILFYNDVIIETKDLIIPHPLLQERRFILTPLAEIAPDLIHPVLHQSIEELLVNCPDPLSTSVYKM